MAQAAAVVLLGSALALVGCDAKRRPADQATGGAAQPDPGPAVALPKEEGPRPTPTEEKPNVADYKELTEKGVTVEEVRIRLGTLKEMTSKSGRKQLTFNFWVEPTADTGSFTLQGWDRSQTGIDQKTGDRVYGDPLKLFRLQWAEFHTDSGEKLEAISRVASSFENSGKDTYADYRITKKDEGQVIYGIVRPAKPSKWILISLPPTEFSTEDRVKIKLAYEPAAAGS